MKQNRKIFILKHCICYTKPKVKIGWSEKHLDGYYIECPICKSKTDMYSTRQRATYEWNNGNILVPTLLYKLRKTLFGDPVIVYKRLKVKKRKKYFLNFILKQED